MARHQRAVVDVGCHPTESSDVEAARVPTQPSSALGNAVTASSLDQHDVGDLRTCSGVGQGSTKPVAPRPCLSIVDRTVPVMARPLRALHNCHVPSYACFSGMPAVVLVPGAVDWCRLGDAVSCSLSRDMVALVQVHFWSQTPLLSGQPSRTTWRLC